MGHHGWRGDPPRTDVLARARIIAAADRCVVRAGVAKTTLSDVAREAGVTRQTVYRYFSHLGDVLRAVAETGAADFMERMQARVTACETPAEVVVEAIGFCLEELPDEPRIGILLHAEQDLFGAGITSPTGLAMGAQFLRGLPVNWADHGIADRELEGLAELMLRLIGSLIQHPTSPRRSADEKRALVRRWLGPALAASTLSSATGRG